MESQRLREQVKDVVSTLSFAWTSLKPQYLQTVHQLALNSSPATRHVQAPFDAPVHDLVTGTMIRPSEMQSNVLDRVIPSVLPSIQSVAEDVLNDHFGNSSKISTRIEDATASGVIDRQLASKAHYWRITRNVNARFWECDSEVFRSDTINNKSVSEAMTIPTGKINDRAIFKNKFFKIFHLQKFI
jgi:hypothetical protein